MATATATATKMLSACGGFIARRHSQIKAKSAASCDRLPLAPGPPAPPAGPAAAVLPQQLQHDTAVATACTTAAAAATAATVATTSAKAASSCCRPSAKHANSQHFSSSYCAIVAFLLIFTVSNPPETSALPRHLYGRHLILQHRHHVHQRAVEEKMIKVHAQPPKGEKCNGTRFSITSDQIMKAKTVANETQAGILALLENYLLQNLSLKSEAQAAEQYALHYLNLDYPLQVEANKSEYDPHPDTTITEEEFIKILDSLSIIHDLVNEKVLGIHPSLYRDIFSFIKEKINHNRNNVLNILGLDDSCVGIPEYAYNGKHNRIEYGVAKEALKILQVLRLKYEYMLTKMAED